MPEGVHLCFLIPANFPECWLSCLRRCRSPGSRMSDAYNVCQTAAVGRGGGTQPARAPEITPHWPQTRFKRLIDPPRAMPPLDYSVTANLRHLRCRVNTSSPVRVNSMRNHRVRCLAASDLLDAQVARLVAQQVLEVLVPGRLPEGGASDQVLDPGTAEIERKEGVQLIPGPRRVRLPVGAAD